MTLEGTNTYLVGRDPVTVIDPGPERRGPHRGGPGGGRGARRDRDRAAHPLARGPLGGVELLGVEPARPADGEAVAGLTALATPGHAEDHLCFLLPRPRRGDGGGLPASRGPGPGPGIHDRAARGDGGSLGDYMGPCTASQGLELERMYPGHGPVIDGPRGEDRRVHRAPRVDRRAAAIAALERGERSRMTLLREVWDDVPEELLPAAGVGDAGPPREARATRARCPRASSRNNRPDVRSATGDDSARSSGRRQGSRAWAARCSGRPPPGSGGSSSAARCRRPRASFACRASRGRSRSRATAGACRGSRARPPHDLWFGQGFAHGQDRLWQCDLQRRVAQGRHLRDRRRRRA